MRERLCIVVGSDLAREVRIVVRSSGWKDVSIVGLPCKCTLIKEKENQRLPAPSETVRIVSACLESYRHTMKNADLYRFMAPSCISMIAGESLVKAYLKPDSHILMPKTVVRLAREYRKRSLSSSVLSRVFGRRIRKIVLFDTEGKLNVRKHLESFARKAGISYEIVPVGLDYLRLFLSSIVSSWRFEQKEKTSNFRLSTYAMIFDHLSDISRIMDEQEAALAIVDMFTVVFSPARIVYVPFENNKPQDRKKWIGSAGDRAWFAEKIRLPERWRKQGFYKGVLFQSFVHQNEIVGLLAIDLFPGQKDEQLLSLASLLADICSVTVVNARAFRNLDEARRILQEERDRARTYLDIAGVIFVVLDTNQKVVLINKKGAEVLGYPAEEIIGKNWFDLFIPAQERESVRKVFVKLMKGNTANFGSYENRILTRDGGTRIISWHNTILRGKDGKITGTLSSGTDITEQKLLELRLRELSLRDELTGLYNRRGFFTLAEHELKIARRTRRGLYLLFVDLDGLKKINDTYGHETGNRLLIDTARILSRTFRESDIIARLGGDEFVVFAREASGENSQALLNRLYRNVEIHNKSSDIPAGLSLSAGIALWTDGAGASIDELLEKADRRMYREKQRKFREYGGTK